MDTFVYIVYSSLEFLTCLYCTQFFLILINLLIDLFFFKLFYCPYLLVIHRYYSFDTLIKVSSSSSSWLSGVYVAIHFSDSKWHI